jgi:hypothetical protein
MKKIYYIMAMAGILAVLSTQQSFAQYGDAGGRTGASAETMQDCKRLEIPATQCNEYTVLQAERIVVAKNGSGSGTPLLPTEAGQLVMFIGVIAGVFGSVAGAFFVKGRKATTGKVPS